MILTRSPYYHYVRFQRFALSVDFIVTVTNNNEIIKTESEKYEIFKQVPPGINFDTWIDLSPLARDLINPKPIDISNYSSPAVITSNEVVSLRLSTKINDSLGKKIDPVITEFLCADGYGYYQEGQNPQPSNKILLSHNEYKAYEKGFFIVPLKVDETSSDPKINDTSVSLNFSNKNSNRIKYLVISLTDYENNVKVDYNGETIYIELIDECKYPPHSVQFLNRFGAIEMMYFMKSKRDTISTSSSDFKNAYTNGQSYDVQKHQIKQFNKKSNITTKLESGFLNPQYNETLKEIIQSEYVWIDGSPVNVVTNSFEFKTRQSDKLISYSIDFENAYDEINNV